MVNCSELESFICNMSTATAFTNLDYRITKDEIKSCTSKLKSDKAVGMDRISAEMIKTSVDQLFYVYETLFNSIFRKGIYPHENKKMSSFKSNENIQKKEDGSYYVVSANKASSVTL